MLEEYGAAATLAVAILGVVLAYVKLSKQSSSDYLRTLNDQTERLKVAIDRRVLENEALTHENFKLMRMAMRCKCGAYDQEDQTR